MPVSVIKNTISEAVISKMVQKAFGKIPKNIKELTEGFFNAAYKISLNDKSVILKIVLAGHVDVMIYEQKNNISLWADE